MTGIIRFFFQVKAFVGKLLQNGIEQEDIGVITVCVIHFYSAFVCH